MEDFFSVALCAWAEHHCCEGVPEEGLLTALAFPMLLVVTVMTKTVPTLSHGYAYVSQSTVVGTSGSRPHCYGDVCIRS